MRSGMQWKSRIRSWLPWSIALPVPGARGNFAVSRSVSRSAWDVREYSIISAILPRGLVSSETYSGQPRKWDVNVASRVLQTRVANTLRLRYLEP